MISIFLITVVALAIYTELSCHKQQGMSVVESIKQQIAVLDHQPKSVISKAIMYGCAFTVYSITLCIQAWFITVIINWLFL